MNPTIVIDRPLVDRLAAATGWPSAPKKGRHDGRVQMPVLTVPVPAQGPQSAEWSARSIAPAWAPPVLFVNVEFVMVALPPST